jgi:outer membrane immunogenic protein
MEDFMRGRFLYGIGLLAFAAAGAGSAIAADFPVKAAPPPVAVSPVVVPDWVGFYVGIHGGGGGAHTSTEQQTFFTSNFVTTPIFSVPDTNASGGIFGFQFGHNWQWGPVVGGLEIDFSGASIEGTSTFFITGDPFDTFTRESKIDELASVRGRLGYLIFPNWLLYGTAGMGWGHFRLNTTDSFSFLGFNSFTSSTSYANEFGWVVGAGLEWKFWDHWLLRGEYLHYDFGRVTFNDTAFPFPFDNLNIRTTVDVGRAALSYKF